MGRKVADQLVETLCRAGVKRIYAVTGDSLNEVNDAVRRAGTIDWVHVRHEESGAFAAGAEAQLNGVACCAGSSGPGHVHLVNGLYDAHRSGCAVLAIASTCASGQFGTQYFQETDPMRLFADCSGYNQLAVTPCQFARMLPAALQHAVSRREVAVVGLPGDLAAEECAEGPGASDLLATPGLRDAYGLRGASDRDAASTGPAAAADENTASGLRVCASEEDAAASRGLCSRAVCRPADAELEELTQMIRTSERIVLFCGIGARDAHAEVVRLAKLLKAPVAYTFKAKMAVQYNNPYEIGMTGLLGLPVAYGAMHEADLLLMLGTDFPYESFLPRECRIVQVDIRPERLGRRARVGLGLQGDVGDTLRALIPQMEERDDASFLERQLRAYRRLTDTMAEVAAKRGRTGNIAPEYAATLIDRMADEDAVFAVDTGMCCVWGARYLHATGRREMLGSFNHGSMANALPQAIGAALARPGQQVVALCGDGGLSMLLGDLATIAERRLPVKIVVFNNRSLGMVKLEMEVAGLPDWQTDMCNPDFAAIAGAMGIPGISVNDPDRLEGSLQQAFAAQGPVLVSVQTNPNALALPPKVEFEQMKGFALAMSRLILAGRAGEVLATARSNMKHLRELVV